MDTCGSGWCSLYLQFTDISSIACWITCVYIIMLPSEFPLTISLHLSYQHSYLVSHSCMRRKYQTSVIFLKQMWLIQWKDTNVGKWEASTQLSDQCVSQLAINAYSSETKKTFTEQFIFFFVGMKTVRWTTRSSVVYSREWIPGMKVGCTKQRLG